MAESSSERKEGGRRRSRRRSRRAARLKILAALAVVLLLGGGAAAVMYLRPPPEPTTAPALTHLLRAKEHQQAGRLKAAVAELNKALGNAPDYAEARLLLARIHLQQGQGAAAERELRRANAAGLSSITMLAPLGQALLLQAKYAELLALVHPADSLSAEERAEIHTLRGEAHLASGKREAAEREFRAAVDLRPNLLRAHFGQIRIATEQNRPDEARRHIQTILAVAPESAMAWVLLGDLEQSLGDYQAAEAAYGEALRYGNRRGPLALKRALVRLELADYAGAEADVETARREAPSSRDLYYVTGLAHFRQDRYEPALEAFQSALADGYRHLPAIFYQGATHLALGNVAVAENYLETVRKHYPQSYDTAKLLGLCRLQRGDFAGAEALLRPLLAHAPDDAVVLRALGRTLRELGRLGEGNDYLNKAAALGLARTDDVLSLPFNRVRLDPAPPEAAPAAVRAGG